MDYFKFFRKKNIIVKIYIIISLAIMFSGSTFIKSYHRSMLIIYGVLAFCMACTKQGKHTGYFVRKKNLIAPFLLFTIFNIFLISQLSYAYVPSIVNTYTKRFFIMSFMLIFLPSIDVSICIIKLAKYYSIVVAISIIISTAISGKKSGGLVGNFQYAGMMMSIAGILFLIDYFDNVENKVNMLGILLSITGLMLSGKRMFSILYFLAFLIIYLLADRKNKHGKFFGGIILCAVTMAILFNMIPATREVFERVLSKSGDIQNATSGRNVLWEKAIDIFKTNRIHGIGFGAFQSYFADHYIVKGIQAYLTHNIYVGLLAETGIIGFVLFVIFLLKNMVMTLKLKNTIFIHNNEKIKYVYKYALLIQCWFIIYGFTGNGMYDVVEMFIYMQGVAMMLSCYEMKIKV
ncbi:O-antigen ligase family protein [Dorea amylophila]|uniref:O-antigen ligase family protein n=1 Tax=Dorea amylophila TaxID=2981789 RepID=A0ABW8B1W9_9FIRM